MSSNELDAILQRVALKENVRDCRIKYQHKNEKGIGYMSSVQTVELQGSNKSLSVVLKIASDNEKLREQVPIAEAFHAEITFYRKVFPAYEQLQEQYKITNRFTDVPKMYKCITEPKHELLVLQNVKLDGYELWNRKQRMNDEHLGFIMQEYGRFHGASYAFKTLNRAAFDEINASRQDVTKIFWQKLNMKDLLKGIRDAVRGSFDPVNQKEMLDAFVDFYEDPIARVESSSVVNKFSIFTHGDCWCTNMLFKYKNNNKTIPESMRLLDFQIWDLASPARDLSYFFYCSASVSAMSRYKQFLKIYHDSLRSYLSQYNLNVDDLLTFNDLLQEWKCSAIYGLMLALVVINLMLAEIDEIPDMATSLETNGDPLAAFNFVGKNDGEFQRRAIEIFSHFFENDLL